MVLRIVLRQHDPLAEWEQLEAGVTSELTFIECHRVLDHQQSRDERPLEFATHDRQLAIAARAMNFPVLGA